MLPPWNDALMERVSHTKAEQDIINTINKTIYKPSLQ